MAWKKREVLAEVLKALQVYCLISCIRHVDVWVQAHQEHCHEVEHALCAQQVKQIMQVVFPHLSAFERLQRQEVLVAKLGWLQMQLASKPDDEFLEALKVEPLLLPYFRLRVLHILMHAFIVGGESCQLDTVPGVPSGVSADCSWLGGLFKVLLAYDGEHEVHFGHSHF